MFEMTINIPPRPNNGNSIKERRRRSYLQLVVNK